MMWRLRSCYMTRGERTENSRKKKNKDCSYNCILWVLSTTIKSMPKYCLYYVWSSCLLKSHDPICFQIKPDKLAPLMSDFLYLEMIQWLSQHGTIKIERRYWKDLKLHLGCSLEADIQFFLWWQSITCTITIDVSTLQATHKPHNHWLYNYIT